MDTLSNAVGDSRSIEEFIEALDSLVPNKCPSITDSDREIWLMAGRRDLVNTLVTIVKQLSENQED